MVVLKESYVSLDLWVLHLQWRQLIVQTSLCKSQMTNKKMYMYIISQNHSM